MSGPNDPWRDLLTAKGVPSEDIERIKAGILALAAAAVPGYCLHPNQVTEYHVGRAGWRRTKTGRRWRLARSTGRGVYGLSCPDCPARKDQLDMGGAFEGRLAPWLLA